MGIYGNYLLEGFFSKNKKEALTPSKSDYNLLSGYLKDLLNNKYSNIKKFCKITPFEIDKGDNSTPPSASLLHYDTYNKFDSYDDYEDKFDSDFNEMISELEKHFKNDKSIKIGVDGDEDSGTVYFYKYKI